MALLNILRYPDARLHKVAAPVTAFDDPLKRLVADMAETMYSAPGVGLAAPQVGVSRRVVVIDVTSPRILARRPAVAAANANIPTEMALKLMREWNARGYGLDAVLRRLAASHTASARCQPASGSPARPPRQSRRPASRCRSFP